MKSGEIHRVFSAALRLQGSVALFACAAVLAAAMPVHAEQEQGSEAELSVPLRIAVFGADVTPPVGAPLAYDRMTWIDKPLSARGVVLEGGDSPVVLCSVDWIGIANEGQTAWKTALAEAAQTTPDRVMIHSVHQHDAPVCDFSSWKILFGAGAHQEFMDPVFAREAIARTASAVQKACREMKPVTHVGTASGEVREVASNRRILGEDGKVRVTRWTATGDPEVRAEPVGTIDPMARLISFWNHDETLAVLTFYATHPQSFYRTGGASPDFPGLAREFLETWHNGVPHIHFAGAGGNIGAGKWNDGSPDNRMHLAMKLADGIQRAWDQIQKVQVGADDLQFDALPVGLPVSPFVSRDELETRLHAADSNTLTRHASAAYLAWMNRADPGSGTVEVTLSRLRLGPADILFLPGEAVVEYQLEAQDMGGDRFVAVAAYGDYGPGYICMEAQYAQGGYEASPGASRVAPETQHVLIPAMQKLLSMPQR